ncbi:Short-chain dehydrogenase cctT [Lachnellula cervina]|uniref:Short-chain dehydrogenase cctT n=1 Tax=Lachnellula cervina TaxID=1316786 RepID=A0A7D8UTC8_9HELO|nr:Short-chain dehydrogenase cctT [Lachnellula cervina]
MDSVLITGCSAGGLGSGIALAFQARNIHVFATSRSLSSLQHLKDVPNVTLLELDVTDVASIEKAVGVVGRDGGRLKYLVNNAGRGLIGPLLDGGVGCEVERKLWEVNYWGVLAVTRAFAPLIIKEKGAVVNIGSSAGLVNLPWQGIYTSSKAATNLLSETLRLELEPLSVRVITVVAGIVKSSFFANLGNEDFELPQGSYYKSLEKHIGGLSRGEDLPANAMGAEEFGRGVVADVLAGKRGNTYTGTLGWASWVVPVFPKGFLEEGGLGGVSGGESVID